MKLVTYDDGRVGDVVDGQVWELDVSDMRRYFELGGKAERTGRSDARPEWKAGRREVVLFGTPAGKIPKPEDMTGAALFLASEDAHHITGSYMIADGGYSMLGA